MRWDVSKPGHNSGRIKSGFLFFPKKINNEWRWLERAKWQQIYHRDSSDPCLTRTNYWYNSEWID